MAGEIKKTKNRMARLLFFALPDISLQSLISPQLSMTLTAPGGPAAASKSPLLFAPLKRPTFSKTKQAAEIIIVEIMFHVC